jgi:hypothetical protein
MSFKVGDSEFMFQSCPPSSGRKCDDHRCDAHRARRRLVSNGPLRFDDFANALAGPTNVEYSCTQEQHLNSEVVRPTRLDMLAQRIYCIPSLGRRDSKHERHFAIGAVLMRLP